MKWWSTLSTGTHTRIQRERQRVWSQALYEKAPLQTRPFSLDLKFIRVVCGCKWLTLHALIILSSIKGFPKVYILIDVCLGKVSHSLSHNNHNQGNAWNTNEGLMEMQQWHYAGAGFTFAQRSLSQQSIRQVSFVCCFKDTHGIFYCYMT